MRRQDNLKWFFVAAISIMAIVAAFVFFISPCWDLTKWTGRFALGQFLMQFLLLPAAGVGFFWTVHQIRKGQEVTDLHLYWSNGAGEKETELTLKIPSTEGEKKLCFKLLNEGHLVAVWYFVEFRIPNELASFGDVRFERISAGDAEDWRISGHSEYWERSQLNANGKDYTRFSFKSRGQEAAYPDSELRLLTVLVRLSGKRPYPPCCEIPYIIAMDRGKPQKGKLIVRLERESNRGEGKS